MTIVMRKIRGDTLKWTGIALLLFYVLAGVLYSAVFLSGPRFPDEQDFLTLSHNLLHGIGYSMDGVHLTASRPPGLPFFIAILEAMGGGPFVLRLAQFLLVGATIVLVSRLGSDRKIPGELLVAAVLVLCYPVIFYLAGTLYAQTLAGFLFVVALYFTLKGQRGISSDWAAGVAFGFLILAVPSFLLTMILTLVCGCFLKLIRIRQATIIVLAAFLVMAGWIARNAIVLHHFVPVASNSGLNFLAANNPGSIAYASSVNAVMDGYYAQADKLGLDEFQRSSFYWNLALTYIGEHPGSALLHYLERVFNFFNIVNVYASFNGQELTWEKQLGMAFSYILLLALLGWRLIEIKRHPLLSREKLLLLVYILSAFTSAIFLTRIRLRVPYDFLLIAVITSFLARRLEERLLPDKGLGADAASHKPA
jgi:hypothetical protein